MNQSCFEEVVAQADRFTILTVLRVISQVAFSNRLPYVASLPVLEAAAAVTTGITLAVLFDCTLQFGC